MATSCLEPLHVIWVYREAALRAYVESFGPGRWEQMRPDYKQILFDNAATAIRPEGRASISCEAIRKFQFPIQPLDLVKWPERYGIAQVRTSVSPSSYPKVLTI